MTVVQPHRAQWTFLTNHAHVLLCIAQDPGVRLRDVAARVGITERSTQSIVADLVAGGYLARTRVGRRNHYEVNAELPLRHPIEAHRDIGELLGLLSRPEDQVVNLPEDAGASPGEDAAEPEAASASTGDDEHDGVLAGVGADRSRTTRAG